MLSLVFTIAALCILTSILSIGYSGINKVSNHHNQDQLDLLNKYGANNTNTNLLHEYAAKISETIFKASSADWKRKQEIKKLKLSKIISKMELKVIKKNINIIIGLSHKEQEEQQHDVSLFLPLHSIDDITTDLDELYQHAMIRATTHLMDSTIYNRNILTICHLELQNFIFLKNIYLIQTKTIYQFLLHMITLLLIIIGILYPSPFIIEKSSLNYSLLGLDLICIILLALHVYYQIKIIYYGQNFLISKGLLSIHFIMLIFLTLLATNLIIKVVYFKNLESFLPIRALLLLLIFPSVHEIFILFITTIIKARHVFLLFFLILLCCSLFALILIGKTVNANQQGWSFQSIIHSFTTLFIYMMNGDNFEFTVYPAVAQDSFNIIFFTLSGFFGMYFITAMLIALFQDNFQSLATENFL